MVFHSGCTIFDLYHQCTSVRFSTSSTLVISVFFFFKLVTILMSVKDCLTVVLIYISLVINNAEYLFMC